MKSSIADTIVFAIFFTITVFGCFAFIISFSESSKENGRKEVQIEAVERGYGSWVSDKSGKTEFKWKEEK